MRVSAPIEQRGRGRSGGSPSPSATSWARSSHASSHVVGACARTMLPSGEQPAAGELRDLVEVAVRPRHQQLVLDRAPEAPGEVDQRRGPAGTERSRQTRSQASALAVLGRPGRRDAPGAHVGLGVGVAGQQLLDRGLVVPPQRGAADQHPPGQVDVVGRGVVEQLEVLAAARPPRPACAAPGAVLGLVGARGGHVGQPGQPPRHQHRGAPLLGGPAAPAPKNGSTTPGLCSVASTRSTQSRKSPVDSSPLTQHVPGGADGQRARSTGSGSRAASASSTSQRALVGAHRRRRSGRRR